MPGVEKVPWREEVVFTPREKHFLSWKDPDPVHLNIVLSTNTQNLAGFFKEIFSNRVKISPYLRTMFRDFCDGRGPNLCRDALTEGGLTFI